ncbi:MAG TPA: hypothetical protein VFH63_09550, partial [candidate division Zixibacteria bacterium]|nr:hypothetical protein [candidate division Zixibacteria bacterium]
MLPAVLLGVLAALLLSPGLLVGPSLDPSVFVQVASELKHGATLYADAWDHKPPGIYLLYAAGQLLLPFLDEWLVAWLLSMAATTGTALLVARILRRTDVAPAVTWVAAAGAVVAMAQYLTALGGGLTEPIALLPLTAALALAVGTASIGRLLLIGALLSVTLLIAIPLLPGAVAVLAYVAWRPGLRAVPLVVAGGALPALATAGWLAWTGALEAAVDAVVGYSAAYRLTNDAAGWMLSAPVVTWTVLALLFLIGPALLGITAGWRVGGQRRALALAAVGWIGLSLVLFAYQGRFFAHYAIPLAVPLAILAGFGMERLTVVLGSVRAGAPRLAAALPVLLVVLISVAAAVAGGRFEWLPVARDHERSLRVAEAIRAQTDEGDTIWVWGNEPQLYLAAERRSATHYDYLYPLVTPGYTTAEMVADTAADLAAEPPPVIVDAGSREPGVVGFQQLLIPRPLTSDGRDLDILDPLRDFVRGHYTEGQ